MPVVTRSKRKSVDYYEIPKTTKRNVAKLRDITNRKNDSEGNSAKKVKLSVHKSDSALCVSRTSSFKDVKPSQSFLRLKPACSDVELASQQSIVSQASFGDALNAMKKVKKVIEDKLSSPAELLQLDIKPKCLYDIDFCHANHKASKIPQRASTEVSFLSQLYLTEERHFNFVHHIRRNLIANRIFPGTDILLSIFKEIMVSNSSTSLKHQELTQIKFLILTEIQVKRDEFQDIILSIRAPQHIHNCSQHIPSMSHSGVISYNVKNTYSVRRDSGQETDSAKYFKHS